MYLNLKSNLIYSLLFIVILSVYYFCASLGLSGDFLFDDFPNLEGLGQIHDSLSFWQFVTEGFSGHLGRPISLFSFAMQYGDWQQNPAAFKHLNILLHLLNSCLIFVLAKQLATLLKLEPNKVLLVALITMSVWLLHPLHISTVLYVVQRMTQLMTLFTLLALITYIYGRQCTQLFYSYLWMSCGLILFGILAVLSKENGVLLLFYVLSLEFTLLSTVNRPRYFYYWFSVVIIFPIAILFAYFITHPALIIKDYQVRDFSLIERMMTQFRVLWDYVFKLFLLKPQFGLFQDDFVISRSLFNPFTTIIALISWLAVLGLAFYKRQQWRLFAFAILFFLAGHLLESTVFPLFIYFEHRNYLPSFALIFAAVVTVVLLLQHLSELKQKYFIITLTALWGVMLIFLNYQENKLWSNSLLQGIIWAEQHPNSRLALANVSSVLGRNGYIDKMLEYHQKMIKQFPEDATPLLMQLATVCLTEKTEVPDFNFLKTELAKRRIDAGTPAALNMMAVRQTAHACPRLSNENVELVFQSLLSHPIQTAYHFDIQVIYAQWLGAQQHYAQAVAMADKALSLKKDTVLQFNRVYWLIMNQQIAEASAALTHLKVTLNSVEQQLYKENFVRLETRLKQLQKSN